MQKITCPTISCEAHNADLFADDDGTQVICGLCSTTIREPDFDHPNYPTMED